MTMLPPKIKKLPGLRKNSFIPKPMQNPKVIPIEAKNMVK